MSERPQNRRPATFRLDDPGVVVVDGDEAGRPGRGTVQITRESEPAQLPAVNEPPVVARRGFRWGTVFWSATAGLVLLGAGLGVTNLVDGLFARSESLGYLGLSCALVAALALVVMIGREVFGLARLETIEKLHRDRKSVV